jgi:hypothetical protein
MMKLPAKPESDGTERNRTYDWLKQTRDQNAASGKPRFYPVGMLVKYATADGIDTTDAAVIAACAELGIPQQRRYGCLGFKFPPFAERSTSGPSLRDLIRSNLDAHDDSQDDSSIHSTIPLHQHTPSANHLALSAAKIAEFEREYETKFQAFKKENQNG